MKPVNSFYHFTNTNVETNETYLLPLFFVNVCAVLGYVDYNKRVQFRAYLCRVLSWKN